MSKLLEKYKQMINVCYNENCKDYKYYGGKGIKVCDRWLNNNGFMNFVEDLGIEDGLNFRLVRVNKSLDYSKCNVECILSNAFDISKHYLYQTYNSMVNRCYRENTDSASYYKHKGIQVCDRWLEVGGVGFLNFIEDMGDRPLGYTLDRVNNDEGYSPNNCKWSSKTQQVINRGLGKNNKSGKKGVYFDKNTNKWEAVIFIEKKRVILGKFSNIEDAIKVREEAEKKYYLNILT